MNTMQQWLAEAKQQGAAPGEYLAALLQDAPERLPQIARALGMTPIAAEHLASNWRFDVLSLPDAISHAVLPIEIDGIAYLVFADPLSSPTRNWAQLHSAAKSMHLAMSVPGAVQDQLRSAEKSERTMMQFDDSGDGADSVNAAPEISASSIARDESPVVRLVNSMLFDALQLRASDIHVESTADGLVIKYRIDGVLQNISQAHGVDTAEQALSRIKVLSSLDIGERRVPQDGRFKVRIQGRDIDLRVSIMPSIHGEDAVMRVLDKSARGESLKLSTLGLPQETIDKIQLLSSEPYGMLLVTGPTGSGKSTTLYAALSESNTGEKKIITIEDPVEYELPGILQIPVNDKKGLTFARGLRSILRHDPDTILVGEIRDGETAGIAVQAALTGHLVLSSIHANGAFNVLERFLFMGVEPASFVEALNGVVAQRLVRCVCDACGTAVAPDPVLVKAARLSPQEGATYRAGKGCEACRHTGYRGRIAIAEVLRVSDTLKEGLLKRVSAGTLRDMARAEGHVTIREIALASAAAGVTTLEEVHRVLALY